MEEIMSWGINKDIFVLCHGDRFEMVKIYFQSHNPYEIADLLYNYANVKTSGQEKMIQRYNNLENLITNPKFRKVNTFAFK